MIASDTFTADIFVATFTTRTFHSIFSRIVNSFPEILFGLPESQPSTVMRPQPGLEVTVNGNSRATSPQGKEGGQTAELAKGGRI